MKINFVIARDIDGTAIIQGCMKNGNCIVLCHINLVEDSETTVFCTLIDSSFAELNFVVHESVCANQISAVSIYMKRNIVRGTVAFGPVSNRFSPLSSPAMAISRMSFP